MEGMPSLKVLRLLLYLLGADLGSSIAYGGRASLLLQKCKRFASESPAPDHL